MYEHSIIVLELSKDTNYLKRMTMLFCINELCDVVSIDVVEEFLLPTIIDLSKDKVANVRFNVAKTLAKMDRLFESSSYDLKVHYRLSVTSNVGSVVEFSPATREARVQFPDVAFYILLFSFANPFLCVGKTNAEVFNRRQRCGCGLLRGRSTDEKGEARVCPSACLLKRCCVDTPSIHRTVYQPLNSANCYTPPLKGTYAHTHTHAYIFPHVQFESPFFCTVPFSTLRTTTDL